MKEFLKNLLLFSGSSCHLFYVRALSKKYGLLSPSLSLFLSLPLCCCLALAALFVMASHGFYSIWGENLFPVRRFICVIKLLATCNNAATTTVTTTTATRATLETIIIFGLSKFATIFHAFRLRRRRRRRKNDEKCASIFRMKLKIAVGKCCLGRGRQEVIPRADKRGERGYGYSGTFSGRVIMRYEKFSFAAAAAV